MGNIYIYITLIRHNVGIYYTHIKYVIVVNELLTIEYWEYPIVKQTHMFHGAGIYIKIHQPPVNSRCLCTG